MKLQRVRIDQLVPPGRGMGELPDGRRIFVDMALPGDLVELRLLRDRKRYAEGSVERILESGPDRIEPACPEYQHCGGCDLMHLEYVQQIRIKQQMLAETLQRQGVHIAPEIQASPAPFGYRTRARLHPAPSGWGFRERGSRSVIKAHDCPVLAAPMRRVLEQIPPEPQSKLALLCNRHGECAASLLPERKPPKGWSAGVTEDYGFGQIHLDAGGFAQANAECTAVLCRDIAQLIPHGAHLVELYAGSGTLSLALASRAGRVRAYEGHPAAIAALNASARAAGMAIEGQCMDLNHQVPERTAREWLVVDPPRTGLSPLVLATIEQHPPANLLYLSCNPATLARDLSRLSAQGLQPELVRGYDMYAQTTHLEVLALLRHKGSSARC